MLRHACISLALLLALGTAAHAQDTNANAQKNPAASYQGCKETTRARDPYRQPVRDYQRLLDCTKRALEEAKARLEQLTDVKLDNFAESLLDANEGLKSQLQLKNDRISQLETENAEKDDTIAGLTEQVRQLTGQVAALEREQTRLQGVIDGQRASLDAALKRNVELEKQVEAYEQQIADLTTRVGELETQLANARGQIQALWCHVDRLTSERSAFYSELQQALGNDQRIKIVGDTFIVPLDILFKVGSAELSTEGRQRIDTVAPLVIDLEAKVRPDVDWVLQVNGHTDIQPYRFTTRFPKNNWELSVARALSVVARLEEDEVPGKRLAAAGYSEFRPIDDAKTQEAFSANRRVEFKLVEYSRQLNPQEPCPPLPENPEIAEGE